MLIVAAYPPLAFSPITPPPPNRHKTQGTEMLSLIGLTTKPWSTTVAAAPAASWLASLATRR